jgi:hypothetical protein
VPEDPAERLSDLIATPLEELVVSLGSGIGRAQAELDRHSIETQRRIDEDPLLAQYGLQATWYQLPRTELELRIAVGMRGQETAGPQPTVTPAPFPGAPPTEYVAGQIMRPLPRIFVEPVNARYQNQFGYDVQAASMMKLTVAPVPPPAATAAPPVLSGDEALEKAREATLPSGGPVLFVGNQPGWRTSVNFNAGLRAWFVTQTLEEEDKIRLRALVKVDDNTGGILKALRQS